MEGFCTRCGDCCQNINLQSDMTKDQFINYMCKLMVEDRYLDDGSAELVVDHWTPQAEDPRLFDCNFFDSDNRLCTHPNRPAICTGFPWYGGEPSDEYVPFQTHKRCGFWYDVDPDKRPNNILPVVQ